MIKSRNPYWIIKRYKIINNISNNCPYETKDKTELNCPKCKSVIFNEVVKNIDYPLVCLICDENLYNFEVSQ